MIYLDYSATTPVDNQVLETYIQVTKEYIGNPNSLHKLGLEAKRLIDAATSQIANILNVDNSEIIYTSGASEANNTAIKGVCLKYQNRGKHIITSELEHSSVIEPLLYLKGLGFEIDFVPLDDNGIVDLQALEKLMRNDTILVSIASVNSELGINQPIDKISKIVRKYPKAYFHSDVTQSIGKQNLDFSLIDLASFSAQKFFGMKGIGCLIKRNNIVIEPLVHGGKSTTTYRGGTPTTALITSLSKALRLAYENLSERFEKVDSLNKYLLEKLKLLDVSINSNSFCVPHIVNISLNGIKPETMLHALEEKEIYISTQTACSTSDYSKAVYALTKDKDKSRNSMRISISHLTSKEEIDTFISVLKDCINKLADIKK